MIAFRDESNCKYFNINSELNNAISIYNKSVHSTTGFPPETLFNSTDQTLFNKIIEKTKNSQKYKKKNIFHSVENRKGLMCENFKINGNTIKKPVFGGKVDI